MSCHLLQHVKNDKIILTHEKKTEQSIYSVLRIILLLSTINALHATFQGIGGRLCPDSFGIQWLESNKWMQNTVIIGRMAGGLVLSALHYTFTINIIKGYKKGVLFP